MRFFMFIGPVKETNDGQGNYEKLATTEEGIRNHS